MGSDRQDSGRAIEGFLHAALQGAQASSQAEEVVTPTTPPLAYSTCSVATASPTWHQRSAATMTHAPSLISSGDLQHSRRALVVEVPWTMESLRQRLPVGDRVGEQLTSFSPIDGRSACVRFAPAPCATAWLQQRHRRSSASESS